MYERSAAATSLAWRPTRAALSSPITTPLRIAARSGSEVQQVGERCGPCNEAPMTVAVALTSDLSCRTQAGTAPASELSSWGTAFRVTAVLAAWYVPCMVPECRAGEPGGAWVRGSHVGSRHFFGTDDGRLDGRRQVSGLPRPCCNAGDRHPWGRLHGDGVVSAGLRRRSGRGSVLGPNGAVSALDGARVAGVQACIRPRSPGGRCHRHLRRDQHGPDRRRRLRPGGRHGDRHHRRQQRLP